MAQNSFFWNTEGTGDGDNAGITMAQMVEMWRALFTANTGADLGGVASDYLNRLAVSGTSSPITVASGLACVYGYVYTNSAAENVTVPTPSTHPRIDRIVLRVNWTAQTVRITRIAGTEAASPSAPALTQSAGTTWDIPLAQVQITTGGVITVTDQRKWLSLVGDGTVSADKLGSDVVLGPTFMRIPLAISNASPSSPSGDLLFGSTFPLKMAGQVLLDPADLPANATVKLQIDFPSSGGGNTKTFDLYNETTSASVTGSTITSTSDTAQIFTSGDFKANLASGSNKYKLRGGVSAGSINILRADLLIEW